MLKDLVDGLHHHEQIRNGEDQPTTTEQGAPEWLKAFDHTEAYTDT
jgi:hypothetical protein